MLGVHPFWVYEPLNIRKLTPDRKALAKEFLPALTEEELSVPFDTQVDAHACTNDTLLVLGGNQSGKSVCATIETIISMTGHIPFLLEKTYPSQKIFATAGGCARVICENRKVLGNVVLRNFRKWTPPEAFWKKDWEHSFDNEHSCLHLKTITGEEVTIEFRTYRQRVQSHQGATLQMAVFDEIPPLEIFKETIARFFASKNWRVVVAATPTQATASWLYYTLSREAEERSSGVSEFHLSSLNNPYIQLSALRRIATLSPGDEGEIMMRFFGYYKSEQGFIYRDIFRRSLHVIPPVPIDENFIVVRGIDPHLSKGTTVLEAAVDREGIVYICGIYEGVRDIQQVKRDLATRAEDRGYRLYTSIIDATCNYTNSLWGRNPYIEFVKRPNSIPLLGLSNRGPGVVEGDIGRIRDYLANKKLFIFDTPELRSLVRTMESIERGEFTKRDSYSRTFNHLSVIERQHDTHACLRYIFQTPLRYVDPLEYGVSGDIISPPEFYS